jgi:hypothetical protein
MLFATSLKRDSLGHSAIMNFDNAIQRVGGAGRRAHVLVNNRAEENAPLTVKGLVGMLRGEGRV